MKQMMDQLSMQFEMVKVMLEGTSGMWALWLSFFREHCASFVALFVLLPFTIWKNWQLGLLLVCLVLLFGSLTGSMLPFILQRVGFDPATASAPFVATLVDVSGLVIYFTVALVILKGTLL